MPSRTTACRARRRQQGSLLASSWRPRGRCPVAPARSEAEAAANAHLVVGDVSPDVVEIPTGLTPRAQVLQPRRLITASPVIPIGVPPLVVRSVQHTVGRSARPTVITARPASAGAGNRTAEYRRNNAPVLRRYSAVATSTGPPQETNPAPPGPPTHPLASGQVVRSAQCGPLAFRNRSARSSPFMKLVTTRFRGNATHTRTSRIARRPSTSTSRSSSSARPTFSRQRYCFRVFASALRQPIVPSPSRLLSTSPSCSARLFIRLSGSMCRRTTIRACF